MYISEHINTFIIWYMCFENCRTEGYISIKIQIRSKHTTHTAWKRNTYLYQTKNAYTQHLFIIFFCLLCLLIIKSYNSPLSGLYYNMFLLRTNIQDIVLYYISKSIHRIKCVKYTRNNYRQTTKSQLYNFDRKHIFTSIAKEKSNTSAV